MPFVGFVVNRVHADPAREARPKKKTRTAVDAALGAKLVATLREQQVLATVERRALARLEVDTRERPVLVPEMEQDVHDLRGLAEFGRLMFEGRKGAGRDARAVAS
jgi:hypothetical protein